MMHAEYLCSPPLGTCFSLSSYTCDKTLDSVPAQNLVTEPQQVASFSDSRGVLFLIENGTPVSRQRWPGPESHAAFCRRWWGMLRSRTSSLTVMGPQNTPAATSLGSEAHAEACKISIRSARAAAWELRRPQQALAGAC